MVSSKKSRFCPPALLGTMMSSLALGLAFPIPTLGGLVPNWQLVHPSTSALLLLTVAKAPIAVALVRLPEVTSAPKPKAEFLLPVELVTDQSGRISGDYGLALEQPAQPRRWRC